MSSEDTRVWDRAWKRVRFPALCAVLAACGLYVGVSGWIRHPLVHLDYAKAQWTELRETYKQKYRKSLTLDAWLNQLMDIERLWGSELRRMSPRRDEQQDFSWIQKAAAQYSLRVLNYSRMESRNGEVLALNFYDLQLAGDYRNLLSFYSDLAVASPLISVESLEVSARASGVLARLRLGLHRALTVEEVEQEMSERKKRESR